MTQMPALDITDLPEYQEAFRAHRIALGAAEAAGDELGALQAKHDWQKQQNDLRDRKYAALQHTAALDASHKEAVAKFPKVKPELYAHISDPAQVLVYAQQLQESIDEAAGTQAPEGQSWGGGVPTAGAVSPPAQPQTVTPRSDQRAQLERIGELAPTVYTKGKRAAAENQELRQLAISPIMNRLVDNMSKSVGHDVETGLPLTEQ